MADDIEQFIQEQKAKLARERDHLGPDDHVVNGDTGTRQKWDKNPDSYQRPASQHSPEPPEGSTLPLGGYQEKRKELEQQRKKEYNAMVAKQNVQQRQVRYFRPDSSDNSGLPIGNNDQVQQKLREERSREYNDMLKKLPGPLTRPQGSPQDVGLPVGSYDQERKHYDLERQNEYNQLLKQLPHRRVRQVSSPEHKGLPLGSYDEHRKQLDESRKREYKEMLQRQLMASPRRNGFKENIPPKPDTPELGMGAKLGSYEDKRKKLQEERKKEYNAMMSKNTPGRLGGRQGSASGNDDDGPLPGMRDRTAEQERMRLERNKEYNDFIEKKRQRGRSEDSVLDKPAKTYARKMYERNDDYREFLKWKEEKEKSLDRKYYNDDRRADDYPKNRDDRRPEERDTRSRQKRGVPPSTDEYYATLPGVRDHNSAQQRQMNERNREYNQFLREKQRSEHNRPVIRDDLSDDGDEEYKRYLRERQPPRGWATPTYEEILDEKRKEESRYRRYDDPEYGGMRSSVSDGHLNRIRDTERRFEDLDREYETKKVRFATSDRRPRYSDDVDPELSQWESSRQGRDRGRDAGRPPPHDDGRPRAPGRDQDGYSATLMIGNNRTASAETRSKEAYRLQLQKQMKESQAARSRAKEQDLRVHASGALDIGRPPERHDLGPPRSEPRPDPRERDRSQDREYRRPAFDHDNFSPREILFDDLHPRGGRSQATGILDQGWEGLYKQSSYLGQPGSLLNAGGQATLGPYNSAVDDAYYYYGLKDPLDITGNHDGGGPSTSGPPPDRQSRVQFDDRSKKEPNSQRGASTPFPVEDDGKSKADAKKQYQLELQRQIEESKRKKQKEKEEREKYDRKLEEEIRNYDPFGRGGGGAPMKDNAGNVVADLRQMHNVNEDSLKNPYSARAESTRPPDIPQLNLDTVDDDNPHARGGNGIFGEPKTKEQKTALDRYKDDLQKQIEEKQRLKEIEKEKERQEEEKEMKRLEEERKKIQAEFEAEQQKQREKEEEARKKNEEMKRLAEEKRKDAENKRKEADEKRLAELRREEEEKRLERQREAEAAAAAARSSSPPVPALRTKIATDQDQRVKHDSEGDCPRAYSKPSTPRPHSRHLAGGIPSRPVTPGTRNRPRTPRSQDRQRTPRYSQSATIRDDRKVLLATINNRPMTSDSQTQTPRDHGRPLTPRAYARPLTPRSYPRPLTPRTERKPTGQAPPMSPPIPTLQKKESVTRAVSADKPRRTPVEQRTNSPPVPSLRTQPESRIGPSQSRTRPPSGQSERAPSRATSADVLNQLAKMRQQLQSERKRVENALESQKNEPEVYDPRLYQKPPIPPAQKKENVDVFEVARNKEPVSVRRGSSLEHNNPNLKDFQDLKHKRDTGSRQDVRNMFPDDPRTGDALETQQLALLQAQEERLKQLQNGKSPYEDALPNMNPKDMGLFRAGSTTSAQMLDSESAFIVNSPTGYPDDLDDLARKRNDSARSRRRSRADSPRSYVDPMGSVMSLDPDSIARRNEDRLRQLKTLSGDDISTGDPDDILDRFMAKQRHNRPPSGLTLQDDTWLQPGTGR